MEPWAWIAGVAALVLVAAGAWIAIVRAARARRAAARLPAAWLRMIEEQVPYYRILPPSLREQLQSLTARFLAEKRFEGCRGFTITDEVRVSIASQACLLLLNRETECYPSVSTVYVYPGAYKVPVEEEFGSLELQSEDVNVGESWESGVVVLSWDDVCDSVADPGDGYNVVLHEFAHQLDDEDGFTNGAPQLEDYGEWSRAFTREYERLKRAVDRGEETLFDDYGAEDPAEFFAVATETFFEMPRRLRRQSPELYRALSGYYRVDPADWGKKSKRSRSRELDE